MEVPAFVPWLIGILTFLAILVLGIPFLRGKTWQVTNDMLQKSLIQTRVEMDEMRESYERKLSEAERRCDDKVNRQNQEIARLQGRVDSMTGEFAQSLAQQVVQEVRRQNGNT